MSVSVGTRPLHERAIEVLRRSGNPFRNYFARNPDDEVCTRYHVPELFATERDQLLGVVDLYRYDPTTHSEVVPVLGNKGAGKTHLLHSIKHGGDGAFQLLVTPGTYHKDTDFLEFLLFQLIDTLLGGGKQRGNRPLEFVGEELCRQLMRPAMEGLTSQERLDLFPTPGLGRWARRLGLGASQAQERTQWLLDSLAPSASFANRPTQSVRHLCQESGLAPERACQILCAHIERVEAHNAAGLMRRHIHQSFARAAFLGDESGLANFLTFGFAELEFQVRPTRQDLVLALFKVLMEAFLTLRIPVVVAFDQLEDLLLVRRTEDGHRVAEAFFAGIVKAMHQIDGICFLVFAERGLWNRFVPSLDGYIQDRINNPIHVPRHGTIKTLRLEAPSPDLVRRVVAARLRPALEELPDFAELPPSFPFQEEQVVRIARTEPTLRDMLQQFRQLFDHLIYGGAAGPAAEPEATPHRGRMTPDQLPVSIKSVVVVETSGNSVKERLPKNGNGSVESAAILTRSVSQESPPTLTRSASEGLSPPEAASADASDPHQPQDSAARTPPTLEELWEQEIRSAHRQLKPQGALTGATREVQAGLGKLLQICHEHGVKVGPWRLQHVADEVTFGDHPTYGVLTLAHWACRDGQPWKVGIGLFLGRGPGKPKDLEIKLAALASDPPIIDHLILLRPEDDLGLSGKSKALWQASERSGRHARLEALTPDGLAILYGFPRWLAAVTEAQPEGQPLPNLAELLQRHCEKLLEQLCMPVHQ
jgi:hypothetical protein